jgi:hypothetical protein
MSLGLILIVIVSLVIGIDVCVLIRGLVLLIRPVVRTNLVGLREWKIRLRLKLITGIGTDLRSAHV